MGLAIPCGRKKRLSPEPQNPCKTGGGGGIRTHGTLAGTPVFKFARGLRRRQKATTTHRNHPANSVFQSTTNRSHQKATQQKSDPLGARVPIPTQAPPSACIAPSQTQPCSTRSHDVSRAGNTSAWPTLFGPISEGQTNACEKDGDREVRGIVPRGAAAAQGGTGTQLQAVGLHDGPFCRLPQPPRQGQPGGA